MLINRNITTPDGRSSMRLDKETWDAVAELCLREDITLADLIARIEAQRAPHTGRTEAVRAYVIAYYRAAAQAGGHAAAGHGEVHKIVA